MKGYSYICIEGNIGAGKSVLSRLIHRHTGRQLIHEEFEDNSFLPKFYQNPAQYAFPLEMSFLASRYNQLKSHFPASDLFGAAYIADYAFFKNLVFARITLQEDEYKLFMRLYDIINPQLPRPELTLYLHQPVSSLLKNIEKRGRIYEKGIREEYLYQIENSYLEYFKTAVAQRIVIVNVEHIDFIRNQNHLNWLMSLTEEEFSPGITRLVPPDDL